MRLTNLLSQTVLLVSALHSSALAASWTFADGSVNVAAKGAGVGGGLKEQLTPSTALTTPIKLGATDSLKVTLTTQDGKTAKRPHQAFLLLQDSSKKLDVSYPFSVKESGKAKLELSHKDLPSQLLRSTSPLSASIVIASFGSSAGYDSEAFPLTIELDPNVPIPAAETPERYGKLPEIHHIFRPDARSPNVAISAFFLLATLATLPPLLGAWLYLGGNINHISKALSDAPLSHALFLGSVVGIEGVFFLYYTAWNLFQALPALGVLGVVAFFSGSRALTEVQERRLAGLR
ncbi:dolichyl-diphosphooligosaccharide-protein glycosyltransferase [Exophiala viscosa]|uniref:Dolichyl-diphosphooligosaccharide-protein glycosyltransferase n=1 Tax=Exophiala viscosa TaxID=2486360 RepID=A0AAN6IC57_9EURO|nr:dolichyl-diphosphooligosaccharide-protein glycosyltransferase [Exophiala viscosa]